MRFAVRPVVSLATFGAAVAMVSACSASPMGVEASAGSRQVEPVVVYGQATSSSFNGVVASVTAEAEDSACTGGSYGSVSGATSDSGFYDLTLTPTSPLAGCVVVTGNSGGATASESQGSVTFGSGDSVQVNLLFP